jgi:hypothetical protein
MIPIMQTPMMSQGSMGQGSQNGSKNGAKGGGFDPLKAIMEGPSMILGQLLAQDLVQAKQSGVPTDSLIQTLLSMSPLAAGIGGNKSMGESNSSMSGGGNQPPGGPQPPNGGPPPGDPSGMQQDDQTGSAMGAGKTFDANVVNVLSQMPKSGIGGQRTQPNPINQALTGQIPQETQFPQMLPPKGMMQGASFDQNGNVHQEGMGNQALRMLTGFGGASTGQAINRQVALGNTPQGQLSQKIKQAQMVPASQAEKLTADASKATLLFKFGQDVSTDFTKATEDYAKQFQSYNNLKASLTSPGSGAADLVSTYEFIKFLDPNMVKQDERMAVSKAQSYLQRLGINVKGKMFNGETLTPEARKSLLQAAYTKRKALAKGYNSHVKGAWNKLSRQGIDPNDFLVDASQDNDDKESSNGKTLTVGRFQVERHG